MTNKKAVEIIETFTANIFTEELEAIKKDLEIFEIIKKHLRHFEAYYKNQAEWGREEFRFILESDNIWLEEEQREQYKKDFNTLKEWYLKEVDK